MTCHYAMGILFPFPLQNFLENQTTPPPLNSNPQLVGMGPTRCTIFFRHLPLPTPQRSMWPSHDVTTHSAKRVFSRSMMERVGIVRVIQKIFCFGVCEVPQIQSSCHVGWGTGPMTARSNRTLSRSGSKGTRVKIWASHPCLPSCSHIVLVNRVLLRHLRTRFSCLASTSHHTALDFFFPNSPFSSACLTLSPLTC